LDAKTLEQTTTTTTTNAIANQFIRNTITSCNGIIMNNHNKLREAQKGKKLPQHQCKWWSKTIGALMKSPSYQSPTMDEIGL
jgi:hypothetical protein